MDAPAAAGRPARARVQRQANVEAVLRELIRRGPRSRLALSGDLQLTQSALTRIVGELMDVGIVVEGEPTLGSGVRGRPRIPVEIRPGVGDVIGVHLGSEHVSASVVALDGTPVATRRANFDGSVADALRVTRASVAELLADSGRHPRVLCAITGGWVDSEAGVVRDHRLLQWRDVDLRGALAADLPGLETVLVESSTRAHVLADVMFGVTSANGIFFHVFVGNVAELAVAVDGIVLAAPDGFGGDLWEMPVPERRGALVGEILTDPALVAQARARGVLDADGDFNALVDLAETEGGVALELLDDRARGVGAVVAELSRVVRPEAIVVSSGVVALPSLLDAVAAPIVASLPSPDLAPRMLSGSFGPASVARAAAAVAIDHLLCSPDRLVAAG